MSVSPRTSRPARPKARKRSRRHSPEEARREIMDSAVRFLWEHTFRDLTIGELMGDTTLSRPAFYQYFTDLHELIEALLSEVGTVMHQTANPWISGEGEPIAALRESLRESCKLASTTARFSERSRKQLRSTSASNRHGQSSWDAGTIWLRLGSKLNSRKG